MQSVQVQIGIGSDRSRTPYIDYRYMYAVCIALLVLVVHSSYWIAKNKLKQTRQLCTDKRLNELVLKKNKLARKGLHAFPGPQATPGEWTLASHAKTDLHQR